MRAMQERGKNQQRKLGRSAAFSHADGGGLHLGQHKPGWERAKKLQRPFSCELLGSPASREAFLLGCCRGAMRRKASRAQKRPVGDV